MGHLSLTKILWIKIRKDKSVSNLNQCRALGQQGISISKLAWFIEICLLETS